ncbi:transcription elongation factor GreB [Sulfuriferula plumbiphila]|uniref:Transcription elongation factor GreB n=1 Tax=Sulfuriferula plumbiphila TaxID=171865 RepID=A0A512LBJ2_9PROT|nr:transcription elongation factor GreB [Sulfuriferula plumbiphila]BBP05784.1 transcription elongation factor GreB [Sulfuriferula plumbiphila]GEP31860.1 transcription elongation factor GreB [Sulfuriferula plumbiphila]
MSKAFTKESDADDEEPAAEPQLPPGAKNYMTPRGHALLKAEFDHLLKVERPQMVETVSWAASNGDRSENGDYIYGKKRLREIDRRLRYLTRRLDDPVVVDPRAQQGIEQVFFGATVSVGEEDGSQHTYQIVGVDEADPAGGRISWVSPLARALAKARAGDVVRFQSPAGMREIEVLEVRYLSDPPQPASAGEK